MATPEDYGGGLWYFIHVTCGQAHTLEKRLNYAVWLKAMPAMFPCDSCGAHLADGLRRYPVDRYTDSAENLLKHSYVLHDEANNHYNTDNPDAKRKTSPSWEEVKAMYLTKPEDYVDASETDRAAAAVVATAPTVKATPAPVVKRTNPLAQLNQLQFHPAFEQLKLGFGRPQFNRR